jgi:hypothetical protein
MAPFQTIGLDLWYVCEQEEKKDKRGRVDIFGEKP